MIKSLLIVAHGSRSTAANEEIRLLSQRFAKQVENDYDLIDHAFLEFAQPAISESIQRAIDHGIKEITVLPYFLSAGRHVAEDIPKAIKIKQDEYPDIKIKIAPYLGQSEKIIDALLANLKG